jgi:hypothetical protein
LSRDSIRDEVRLFFFFFFPPSPSLCIGPSSRMNFSPRKTFTQRHEFAGYGKKKRLFSSVSVEFRRGVACMCDASSSIQK